MVKISESDISEQSSAAPVQLLNSQDTLTTTFYRRNHHVRDCLNSLSAHNDQIDDIEKPSEDLLNKSNQTTMMMTTKSKKL